MLTTEDLEQIRNILQPEFIKINEQLNKMQKRLTKVEKEVKLIKNSLNETIDFFDKRTLQIMKNIDRIERHLNLPLSVPYLAKDAPPYAK